MYVHILIEELFAQADNLTRNTVKNKAVTLQSSVPDGKIPFAQL